MTYGAGIIADRTENTLNIVIQINRDATSKNIEEIKDITSLVIKNRGYAITSRHVDLGQLDSDDRTLITYKIPRNTMSKSDIDTLEEKLKDEIGTSFEELYIVSHSEGGKPIRNKISEYVKGYSVL